MTENNNFGIDFDKMWEQVSQDNKEDALKLTEDQLEEITDEYKVNDKIAYYAHLCKIIELYYNAKLGRPFDQKVETQSSEEDYDYEF